MTGEGRERVNLVKRLLLISILFLAACNGKNSALSDEESGLQTAKSVVIYEAKNGFHTWVLQAEEAQFYENNEKVSLVKPQVVFKKEEKEVSRIKGDKGSLSLGENLIVLEGNVQGKDIKENVTINTSLLNYDMGQKKIWTDKKFILLRNGVKVEGQGFKANGDLTEIEITKQTTTLPQTAKEI